MDEPPRFQFKLASLFAIIFWLAVALGLTRVYPDTNDGLIGTALRALPLQSLLTFAITTALGGIVGAASQRQALGLGIGAIVGLIIGVAWWISRYWYLMIAAGSV